MLAESAFSCKLVFSAFLNVLAISSITLSRAGFFEVHWAGGKGGGLKRKLQMKVSFVDYTQHSILMKIQIIIISKSQAFGSNFHFLSFLRKTLMVQGEDKLKGRAQAKLEQNRQKFEKK